MKKVTDETSLEAAIDGAQSVVLFHATWCPYCREFRPVFEDVTSRRGVDAIEAVIDDDDNPLWEKYGIDTIPTVITFVGGTPVRRLDATRGVGLTAKELTDHLD